MYYWLIGMINPALYFSLERRFRSRKNSLLVLMGLGYLLAVKLKYPALSTSIPFYSSAHDAKDRSLSRQHSDDSGLGKDIHASHEQPVFFYTVFDWLASVGRSKTRSFCSIITRLLVNSCCCLFFGYSDGF
jgi:hypothetical protein